MKTARLTELLSAQLMLFEELLTLMERERGELTGINLDGMSTLNGLKEEVAARIEVQIVPLRQAVKDAAISKGLAPDASLGDLTALLDSQGNKELSWMYKDLNRVAKKVRQAATMNQEIAERFAATMTQSLNFVMRLLHNFDVYGSSGGYQQRQYGAVMFNMEA